MPKSKAKPRPLKKGRPFDPARRRYCSLCKEKVDEVDYKDVTTLRRFVSERAKIKPRRISGACRRHQRQVAVAIKSAREMALLPYVAAVTGREDRQRATCAGANAHATMGHARRPGPRAFLPWTASLPQEFRDEGRDLSPAQAMAEGTLTQELCKPRPVLDLLVEDREPKGRRYGSPCRR